MSLVSKIRSLAMAGAALGLLAAGGASAQEWGYGGAYVGAGVGFGGGGYGPGYGYGAVGYDEGYYGGGAIQALTGIYGGGGYRRAAYSAADVYTNAGYGQTYERSYVVPTTVYRPVVRTHYVPVTTYRAYNTVHYQPTTQYRVLHKRCHCETFY